MEGPVRFTTAMGNARAKPEKDPSATEEEDASARCLPGGGFYDDSNAKLANRYEDRQLAMAIQGIGLEQCRTVAELEHGKKTVQKGFHKMRSQQQLLDVARADNVIGPRRRPPGETPRSPCMPSPRRPHSSQNHRASSSPRQHLYLSPSSPNFNPKFSDPNKTGRKSDPGPQRLSPHLPEQGTRTYDGFRASRPLTSGGRRTAGTQYRDTIGHSTQGAEPLGRGGGLASKPYKPRDGNNRARTAPGFRQRSQNQSKPVPPGFNQIQSKPVQTHHSQPAPVQTGSAQHSADTDSTSSDDDDVDDVAVKRNPCQRSNSAFGISQMHLMSSSDEEQDRDSAHANLPPRQRSHSIEGRPHTTTSGGQSRSRRELSRLTHIDAITAAEMALRRKMWLAKKESQNHVGGVALQQRVQEFITKLDTDKKKGKQQLMMFPNEKKPTEELFVLPAV